MRFIPLTGKTFHRWTVLGEGRKTADGKDRYWRVRCLCGSIKSVAGGSLRSGNSMSCGCLMRERTSAATKTHGMSGSPEHRAWCAMKTRCYNSNEPTWRRYGARGIKVCRRWLRSFDNFYADMGPRPTVRHSVDRINNDGHYTPRNCRWATPEQQNLNTITAQPLTYNGVTMSTSAWARAIGMGQQCLTRRIRRGMSVHRALTTPKSPGRRLVP